MASERELSQWQQVTAPVTPNTTQDWVMVVNTEEFPTLDQQKEVIANIMDRIGAQNVRFERFSPSRILPSKPRMTRETIPNIDFVPSTRGKPVYWLIRWDWFGTEDSVPWPAERHVFGATPSLGNVLTRQVDPLQADVLLAAVGGEQKAAIPEPTLLDRIEDVGTNFKEGAEKVGTGLLVLGVVAGGFYLASKLGGGDRRR